MAKAKPKLEVLEPGPKSRETEVASSDETLLEEANQAAAEQMRLLQERGDAELRKENDKEIDIAAHKATIEKFLDEKGNDSLRKDIANQLGLPETATDKEINDLQDRYEALTDAQRDEIGTIDENGKVTEKMSIADYFNNIDASESVLVADGKEVPEPPNQEADEPVVVENPLVNAGEAEPKDEAQEKEEVAWEACQEEFYQFGDALHDLEAKISEAAKGFEGSPKNAKGLEAVNEMRGEVKKVTAEAGVLMDDIESGKITDYALAQVNVSVLNSQLGRLAGSFADQLLQIPAVEADEPVVIKGGENPKREEKSLRQEWSELQDELKEPNEKQLAELRESLQLFTIRLNEQGESYKSVRNDDGGALVLNTRKKVIALGQDVNVAAKLGNEGEKNALLVGYATKLKDIEKEFDGAVEGLKDKVWEKGKLTPEDLEPVKTNLEDLSGWAKSLAEELEERRKEDLFQVLDPESAGEIATWVDALQQAVNSSKMDTKKFLGAISYIDSFISAIGKTDDGKSGIDWDFDDEDRPSFASPVKKGDKKEIDDKLSFLLTNLGGMAESAESAIGKLQGIDKRDAKNMVYSLQMLTETVGNASKRIVALEKAKN